jgi:hypothetical protein
MGDGLVPNGFIFGSFVPNSVQITVLTLLLAPVPASTTGTKRLKVVAGWDDDIEIIYGNPLTAA